MDRIGEVERLRFYFGPVDRSDRMSRLKALMTSIFRIAVIVYLAQAAAGFAVGFTLPWLLFFGVN
jgi:hypothetical protein